MSNESPESFVADAVPRVEIIGPMRIRRRWIARIRPMPCQDWGAVGAQLEQETRLEMEQFARERAIEHSRIPYLSPQIRLTPLDDTHLVVELGLPSREAAGADAIVAAEWGVLGRLDQRFQLEELQGLPRRCWKLYLGP